MANTGREMLLTFESNSFLEMVERMWCIFSNFSLYYLYSAVMRDVRNKDYYRLVRWPR